MENGKKKNSNKKQEEEANKISVTKKSKEDLEKGLNKINGEWK